MHNNSSPKSSKIAVLIVAAGQGTRMGGGLPKQYRKLGNQTVLEKTIQCFSNIADIDTIAVAIHKDASELYQQSIQNLSRPLIKVFGGATRTQSVRNGLLALADSAPDFVLIHDAARPFLSSDIIQAVIHKLQSHDAVAPALPVVDALKTLDGDTVERSDYLTVQTPQGFNFKKLLQGYDKMGPNEDLPDDIAVAKSAGLSIGFAKGDPRNIKLTYEEDFMKAIPMRTVSASGFDVHRICEGKSLYLGGVKIDAGFALKGHSDADVALHALTDALLGSVCAGDIGDYFPPTDPKWKGADSEIFLKKARDLIQEQNGSIQHVDLTLICERPKIGPHKQAMRKKIADILQIPVGRVSLKATTTEGLGFTGRGEGIAAQAMCSVRLPDGS